MAKEEKNWAQIFIDFSNGLLSEISSMNEEMFGLANTVNEENCDKILAKANQIDADIKRITDYMSEFLKERGIFNETMGK